MLPQRHFGSAVGDGGDGCNVTAWVCLHVRGYSARDCQHTAPCGMQVACRRDTWRLFSLGMRKSRLPTSKGANRRPLRLLDVARDSQSLPPCLLAGRSTP